MLQGAFLARDDVSFFSELKRRNVWRVGIAYVISSWLFLQVLELVASLAGAPEWIGKFFLGLLVIGLPIALVLSWVYELTPEGVKREKDVVRDRSITHETGARLNKITIGVFVIAVVWVVADRVLLNATPADEPSPAVREEIVASEPADKSIAVLPFMNMSDDSGAGHFSDGLADTVLHKLAQIQTLRVVARNSSFQFRGQNVDIREVGNQLNVATILEGSVQAAGNQIRVTAQLIDVANGYHLWSGNFDRELDDVFAIQDEIAEEVVAALQVSLGDEDAARLARRDTDNVDAFREYSIALREMDEFSFESLDRAVEHLDRALEIDPDYATAWASKANAFRFKNRLGAITDKQYEEIAPPIVEQALELDGSLPLALALQAELAFQKGKRDTALSQIDEAVELAPSDATILSIYSSMLITDLRPKEAAEIRLQALEVDPLSIPLHQSAAGLLGRLGRDDEAGALIERMQDLNPDAPVAHWAMSYNDSFNGRWAHAVMNMVKAHELDPRDPIGPTDIGYYLLALGLDEEAEAWMAKAREIDPEHPTSRASLIAAKRGNPDEGTVRKARELLIAEVPDENGARVGALDILFTEAYRTGEYGEILAWSEKFHPEFFDPAIDSIEDHAGRATDIGHLMIDAGMQEQGRRLKEVGLARLRAVDKAYGFRPDYWHFYLAARDGQRDRAIAVLGDLMNTTVFETLNGLRDTRNLPWIKAYANEPAFRAFEDALEKRAAEATCAVARTQWRQLSAAGIVLFSRFREPYGDRLGEQRKIVLF